MLCEEHPASVKFSPCGHTVMCSRCAERAKKCYVCKVSGCGQLLIQFLSVTPFCPSMHAGLCYSKDSIAMMSSYNDCTCMHTVCIIIHV